MGMNYDYGHGRFHIGIKVSGGPDNVRLFHAICGECDSDWPWWSRYQRNPTVKVCSECSGGVINNPRIAPQDLKAAAHQAKVNLKVYSYSPESKCPNHMVCHVPFDEGQKMYTVKPSRVIAWRGTVYIDTIPEGYIEDVRRRKETLKPKIVEATSAEPKALPPAEGKIIPISTESSLILVCVMTEDGQEYWVPEDEAQELEENHIAVVVQPERKIIQPSGPVRPPLGFRKVAAPAESKLVN